MIDDNTRRVLDQEYEKWKVSPGGVIVALSYPWSYTNTRIHIGCDVVGYDHAF